jgi:hypothetical protein
MFPWPLCPEASCEENHAEWHTKQRDQASNDECRNRDDPAQSPERQEGNQRAKQRQHGGRLQDQPARTNTISGRLSIGKRRCTASGCSALRSRPLLTYAEIVYREDRPYLS